MNDTIFTRIIKREIPAEIVCEDAVCIGILDINPVRKGHMLLVSKEPHHWMTDVPNETIAHMFVLTKRFMGSMKDKLGCDYVEVQVIGRDVPHFHVHLIPQYLSDSLPPRPHEKYADGEMAEYGEKLRA